MPELIGLVAHGIAVILGHHLAVVADGGEDDEIGAGAERADLGRLRRPETARKGELALAAHLLAAKQQNRMVLERRAHRRVNGIVGRDIGQRHAAYFGGKAWTQRDDFHGSILHGFLICRTFLQNRCAGNRAQFHRSTCRARSLGCPVVRVDDLVKDGAKRRRLRRSTILDKVIDANRNAVQAIKAAFWAFQKPGSLAGDGINYRPIASRRRRAADNNKRLETP